MRSQPAEQGGGGGARQRQMLAVMKSRVCQSFRRCALPSDAPAASQEGGFYNGGSFERHAEGRIFVAAHGSDDRQKAGTEEPGRPIEAQPAIRRSAAASLSSLQSASSGEGRPMAAASASGRANGSAERKRSDKSPAPAQREAVREMSSPW